MCIDTEATYGPQSLNNFVYPNDEVELMVKSYITGKIKKPILMHGPSGTGKSLLSKLIPNAIEGKKAYIMKYKAVDLNTKEGLKNLENDKNLTRNNLLRNEIMDYYVIEEYEQKLTTKSSLKILLDTYKNIDLTIFTTNRLSMVDTGIYSRCKSIKIPPASPEKFLTLAQHILRSEDVNLPDKTVLNMLQETYEDYGDNRKYYEALDTLIFKIRNVSAV